MSRFTLSVSLVILSFVCVSAYAAGPNFITPIKTDGRIKLVTEAGGASSDTSPVNYRGERVEGPYDPFHGPSEAYYALDLKAEGKGDVIAAADGIIVRVVTKTEDPKYPRVTIDHGNGYFTEYAEFDLDNSLDCAPRTGD